jgi:hypothetical protein
VQSPRARTLAVLIALATTSNVVRAAEPPSPAPLSANEDKVARAKALKDEGDALMGSLEYEKALARYDEGFALGADAALLYNSARALEALGRFTEALTRLESFQARATPDLIARVPNLAELMNDIRKHTCTLQIRANHPAALVSLGGKKLGTTPLAPVRLDPVKSALLDVSLEGYTPVRREVELPAGGAIIVAVELVAVDRRGELVVRSEVEGASVYVDGALVGTAPASVRVEPGEHAILVSAMGHDDATATVKLEPGTKRAVDLNPIFTPIYTTWWFWTASAALLGGAVVGGVVAATSEVAPDSGTITPGTAEVSRAPASARISIAPTTFFRLEF